MTESLTKTIVENQEPNYLDQLVGEGKKYKTVQDLAKAYANANEHIPKIQAENTELSALVVEKDMELDKEKSETRRKVEELLKQAKEKKASDNAAKQTTGTEPLVTDAENIEEVVKKVITESKQQEASDSNVTKAKSKLIEAYGDEDSYKKAVREYLASGELTAEEFDSLAAKSPDALVKLVTSSIPSKKAEPNQSLVLKQQREFQEVKQSPEQSFSKYWKKLLLENRNEYDKRKPELMALIQSYNQKGLDFYKT